MHNRANVNPDLVLCAVPTLPRVPRRTRSIAMSARPTLVKPTAAEASPVRIRLVMFLPTLRKTKTGAEHVGNSTSSAPACVGTQAGRPESGKLKSGKTPGRTQSSAASSSPSASRSGLPARICSAIRPEFWRIATSIFAVMSGLALRNAFEFSRPCPKRWLS
jgi:hypothetical protein